MDRETAEAELRRAVGNTTLPMGALIEALPVGVDPVLAANVLEHRLRLVRFEGKYLPEPVVRELLARELDDTQHVFLRLAVPLDRPVVQAWKHALGALRDLSLQYAWGSRQKRARFRGLADDPVALAAIQGTVAHRTDVPIDWLAVLAADGGAASIDALVSHLDAALVGRDVRLDRLEQLRVHAADTPPMRALLAEIDDTLGHRRAESPALALAGAIGIAAPPELWFRAVMLSLAYEMNGQIVVDSRRADWFSVIVFGRGKRTRFGVDVSTEDELALGRCDAHELPAWLARAAKRLGVRWKINLRTGLRGQARTRLRAWLEP